jgi:hypothetical protein
MTPKKLPDQRLSEKRWTKRFAAAEPRLSQAVQAYQEAGFETRLESLPSGDLKNTRGADLESEESLPRGGTSCRECRICFDGHDEYKLIYTSPKATDCEESGPQGGASSKEKADLS